MKKLSMFYRKSITEKSKADQISAEMQAMIPFEEENIDVTMDNDATFQRLKAEWNYYMTQYNSTNKLYKLIREENEKLYQKIEILEKRIC